MNLTNQPVGKRKSFAQALLSVLERGNEVGHLHDVVDRHARGFIQFEEQKVGKRRLDTLDLR